MQNPLVTRPVACDYDSLFELIDGDKTGTVSLAEYLVWVTGEDKAVRKNSTKLGMWIDHFYKYVK